MKSNPERDEADLDPEILASLRSIADGEEPGFLSELFEAFEKDTRERLGTLRRALEKRDPVIAENAAHALKGSSGNIGASHLSQQMEILMALARQRNWDAVGKILEAAGREFEAVSRRLKAELR